MHEKEGKKDIDLQLHAEETEKRIEEKIGPKKLEKTWNC
jgi:hypothetical protein